jgi:murein DD-endopeptidase MepM/ murein hydrolase activator NlpD
VPGEVTDPFREPACTWCAGNRGIEYRVPAGTSVRAAASGRVVFAGVVVDVRYLVVELASGWRHTYGHLASARLETGDVVFSNAIVGTASGTFFFGLRIGDDYADPAPFLGEEARRPRLVPTDATPARPAPPAQLRCSTPRAAPSAAR